MSKPSVIDSFRGEYDYLSNFYEGTVIYNGGVYGSAEAAFQAQKTLDPKVRKEFESLNPSQAKRKGRQVELRDDWEKVKFDIMLNIIRAKFTQSTKLRYKLRGTGSAELIEGNNWNDRIWGVCKGKGENNLGKILMQVRIEIQTADGWYF